MKFDRLFLRLLMKLQSHARLSNKELADAIGLSASPCLERVRKLEQAKIITGYRADIDLDEVGPHVMIFAEVTLATHHPNDFRRFTKTLDEFPEIISAYKISGPFDYILTLVCRDIRRYHDISEKIINSEPAIAKFSGHVVLEKTKSFQAYPLDKLISLNEGGST